ncbi:glycosyltransferase family 2 protein [Christiangramia salexigens]|uniref:Glycosyl transferase n=1 Tax=Christiangramia salexigens TaxID=1913577 RepID=A0A1L3J6T3_9FLAO|nr:glycosyltransferase [Christiangramia salexigens]APG60814.1 glycosyl transferase [Christiangramia salexigens]
MKDYGLVSIIMPAYNSAAFISESIESVIGQTYSNWELLIVDDASVDGTVDIVNIYAQKDERICLMQNESNSGTHITRNRAIKAAQGGFVAFLDSDDLWKPQKLSAQLKLMKEENLPACFSSYDLIDENGLTTGKEVIALPELSYQKLLKANYVGNLTGIYSVEKLGKIFSPNIRKRQDWALWLEVLKKGGPIKSIREPLATYRLRKDSISNNKIEMLKYNFMVYHKVLGYNPVVSGIKMMIFLREQLFIKSRQVRTIQ